jgi:hypothetical protein
MDKGRTSRRDRTPIEVAAVAVDCAAVFVTEASVYFSIILPPILSNGIRYQPKSGDHG